jgi:hypothetical protein
MNWSDMVRRLEGVVLAGRVTRVAKKKKKKKKKKKAKSHKLNLYFCASSSSFLSRSD